MQQNQKLQMRGIVPTPRLVSPVNAAPALHSAIPPRLAIPTPNHSPPPYPGPPPPYPGSAANQVGKLFLLF